MLIKDPNGKYELRVDKARRIVYEKNMGSWDAETYMNYDEEYKKKILGYLGSGKWTKCVDLRQYKPSTKVTPELINGHVADMAAKGFESGAAILDSATLKMQINRGSSKHVDLGYFDNEEEADKWLKTKGY